MRESCRRSGSAKREFVTLEYETESCKKTATVPKREGADDVAFALKGALTVAELKAELEGMPDDAQVVLVSNYGDRYGTQQALPLNHVTNLDDERLGLKSTGYSDSGLAIASFDEGFPDENDDLVVVNVVALSQDHLG